MECCIVETKQGEKEDKGTTAKGFLGMLARNTFNWTMPICVAREISMHFRVCENGIVHPLIWDYV